VANASFQETLQDAQLYATLYESAMNCPVPLVVRVQGAALGGGTALVACGDVVVATSDASFGCTEVRVGVIPAVVAPYVLDRLGRSVTRRLLLTGERICATEAIRLGLVDLVVDADQLDEGVERVVESILRGNAFAQRSFKALLPKLQDNRGADTLAMSVRASAEFRVSPESRGALTAFLRTIGTQ
jgi:methylglutaconyl-CoA hydratase